jgi:hypothetical protein
MEENPSQLLWLSIYRMFSFAAVLKSQSLVHLLKQADPAHTHLFFKTNLPTINYLQNSIHTNPL